MAADAGGVRHRAQPTRLIKFLVVGGSGVVVNTAALFLLHDVGGVPALLAAPLAVELAIANNFVWNDRWTFGGPRRAARARFVRFNLVSLVGLAITTATLGLLVQLAGVNYLLANLAGIALAAAYNFVASAAWTWRAS